MEFNEKLLETTQNMIQGVVDSANNAIEQADKYNKRMFIAVISMVVALILIVCTMTTCYFHASYGENYKQEINQIIEQNDTRRD